MYVFKLPYPIKTENGIEYKYAVQMCMDAFRFLQENVAILAEARNIPQDEVVLECGKVLCSEEEEQMVSFLNHTQQKLISEFKEFEFSPINNNLLIVIID